MKMARMGGTLLLLALLLSACGHQAYRRGGPSVIPPNEDYAPSPEEIPENVAKTPDAVPQAEPPSKTGNAKTYTVFGESYTVMDNAAGFRQRGYASWYGKKFHGRKTASSERYDIYGMTAAHKTLPLPTYVRVTNLGNGKTAVVKVNDRGPFHSDRIIDLSYAAAAKLGIIGHGTAMVEIEALTPADNTSAPTETAQSNAELKPIGRNAYLQVAAYADPINAVALREELRQHGIGPVEIRINDAETSPVHRVVVGPFSDETVAQETLRRLSERSLHAEWIRD